MKFGASLEDLRRAYVGIALMEAGKEPALYQADNGSECLAGGSAVLRSMLVYWSNTEKKIQTFSVEASAHSCTEYRESEKERRAPG